MEQNFDQNSTLNRHLDNVSEYSIYYPIDEIIEGRGYSIPHNNYSYSSYDQSEINPRVSTGIMDIPVRLNGATVASTICEPAYLSTKSHSVASTVRIQTMCSIERKTNLEKLQNLELMSNQDNQNDRTQIKISSLRIKRPQNVTSSPDRRRNSL